MSLLTYYNGIKGIHVGCVLASGSLFFLRGVFMLRGSRYANHPGLARLSYAIDTTLLLAALSLIIVIHQYPFVQSWLTAKVMLLVVYIVLGVFALRRGKTLLGRGACFLAALAVYGYIIGIAVTHDPAGVFTLLH